MNKRVNNLVLTAICWLGTALIAIISLFQLPSFFSERNRISSLNAKLSDQQAIEARLKAFRETFSKDAESLKTDISRRKSIISNASFSCSPASDISLFVDELQKIFSGPEITLANLAYKTRENKGDIIILPFEATFTCSFRGMRELLHAIETHPAGVRIEQLELLQLDFKGIGAQLKLIGSVRFAKLGE